MAGREAEVEAARGAADVLTREASRDRVEAEAGVKATRWPGEALA